MRSTLLLIFSLFALLTGSPRAAAFSMEVHLDITDSVLKAMGFNAAAIAKVKAGNAKTDQDEFHTPAAHFDSESFAAGSKRLREKLAAVISHLGGCQREQALEELGRCLHSVQDFFAHTNFIDNGGEENVKFLNLSDPPARRICVGPRFLGGLTSGYYPDNSTPKDKCTHSQLNKDSPEAGERHFRAKSRAMIETANFIAQVKAQILAAYPEPGKAPYLEQFLMGVDTEKRDGISCAARLFLLGTSPVHNIRKGC